MEQVQEITETLVVLEEEVGHILVVVIVLALMDLVVQEVQQLIPPSRCGAGTGVQVVITINCTDIEMRTQAKGI